LRKLNEEMAWLDLWFFKAAKGENDAFKKDSLLGQGIRKKVIARVGLFYGIQAGAAKTLVPEVVKKGDLEVGRFEVTRAQYAAFAPKYSVTPGTENYPATGVSFAEAKAYIFWLSKLTGQTWRMPNEDEQAKLCEGLTGENTLDYWAGYELNPDDALRLEAKVQELGGPEALLREVGSFPGAGKDKEELIFDLMGNAAEWVVTKDGGGKAIGASADRPFDQKARTTAAAAACTGFRVVRAGDRP
jgi:formylglycine-generating enzyme required for sulfatase activity